MTLFKAWMIYCTLYVVGDAMSCAFGLQVNCLACRLRRALKGAPDAKE